MSQQSVNQPVHPAPPWLFRICTSVQQWVSKEIIDFDPFDYEVIVAQDLMEQWHQTQSIN